MAASAPITFMVLPCVSNSDEAMSTCMLNSDVLIVLGCHKDVRLHCGSQRMDVGHKDPSKKITVFCKENVQVTNMQALGGSEKKSLDLLECNRMNDSFVSQGDILELKFWIRAREKGTKDARTTVICYRCTDHGDEDAKERKANAKTFHTYVCKQRERYPTTETGNISTCGYFKLSKSDLKSIGIDTKDFITLPYLHANSSDVV